jgi:DUF971 family protein
LTDPKNRATALRSPRGARKTEIDWADGHKSAYPHELLRGYCPCAGCQGHSGTISFIKHEGRALEIDELEGVGNYALQIDWADGHNSGIYSYVYLRTLCPCDVCGGPGGEPVPRSP